MFLDYTEAEYYGPLFKFLAVQKRKVVDPKPEKTQDNEPVNDDLEGTKKHIDELKLSLEKAQKEEHKAKQDLELARVKVEQMEQDIAKEASDAAKAQLEADEATHAAAVSELKALEEELEVHRKKYASMVIERDVAVKEAEEAVAASKEVEKTVEDLATELIAAKESLEAAKTLHLELEKERTKLGTVENLKSKLAASSSLLLDLKAELAAYKQSNLKPQCDEQRKVLEEVKLNIEKATAEVNCLRAASESLKSQLEEEKSVTAMIKRREEKASDAVLSLKDELNRTESEFAAGQKENGTGEEMIKLSEKLQEAAQEAVQAKSHAHVARLKLHKAQEEAEQAKARASEMRSRLEAAQKEIEAVKDSKKLVIEATGSNNGVESSSEVILSVEEYDQLCKLAHDANEQANTRIAAANSQIDMAKESELRSLMKLEELNKEFADRRKLLKDATEKAQKAKEGKLVVEQELRVWRAGQEQKRKASEANQGKTNEPKGFKIGFEGKKSSKKLDPSSNKMGTETSSEAKTKKKKKSFFPRVVMFFAKRKTHPTK